MHFYQGYGLKISSEFVLSELLASAQGKDISICQGKIKLPALEATSIQRQGREALFGGNSQEAYLKWQGVANFLAQNGSQLIVEPETNFLDSKLLSLYILSEALGLILYQRGLFLLHASAVKIGENVAIFLGAPGAGKSTLAAAFARYNYPVLADDMVAISLQTGEKPMAIPGFPQIKIWPSSVEGLGYDLNSLPPLFPGSRKRVIVQKDIFPLESFPVTHIFISEQSQQLAIKKIDKKTGFFSLARFFPCPSGLLQGVALEKHFEQCLQLVEQVGVYKLENPQDFQQTEQLINLIKNEVLA